MMIEQEFYCVVGQRVVVVVVGYGGWYDFVLGIG